MNNTDKIKTIWQQLEKRYGRYPIKDGQSEGYVKQSWLRNLGTYAEKDLQYSVAQFIRHNKYERWPNEAELLEVLRSLHATPEGGEADQWSDKPLEWKAALQYANNAHEVLANTIGRRYADDLIVWAVSQRLTDKPTSWADTIVKAYNRGMYKDYKAIIDDYVAYCNAGRKVYNDAVAQKGLCWAHESLQTYKRDKVAAYLYDNKPMGV